MYNKIKMRKMIHRLNSFLFGLLLVSVFLTGCISQEPAENLSNPHSIQPLSPSGQWVSPTTRTPVPAESIIKNNETLKKWDSHALAQNATFFYQHENRTSYELSLGDITIQQNKTPGSESSSIIQINVTAKNSGTVPIEVIFLIESLKDKSGDGCQYKPMVWCGVIIMDMMPGASKTRTSNVTIFSTKGYDNLLSQNFLLMAIIDYHSDEWGGIHHNVWLIDLKKSP
jgi:hypothetical protein